MRRGLAILGIVLAGAAIGTALVVGLGHQGDAGSPAALTSPLPAEAGGGQLAPPLAGRLLDRAGSAELASYRGKVVVVNFWASWCGPCRAEAPELVAFSRAHPSVQMLSVDERSDPIADAAAFARQAGWTWPIVKDDGSIEAAWRIAGWPDTFVVTADGRIAFKKIGGTTSAELAALVGRL